MRNLVALSLNLAHSQVFNKRYCSSQWNSTSQVKWLNDYMFNSMFDELKVINFKSLLTYNTLKKENV